MDDTAAADANPTNPSVFVVGGDDKRKSAGQAAGGDRIVAVDIGDDPLLECLEFLAKFHGNPRSGEVLKAGLPFGGNRLTPSLFIRAAERAGINSRVVKRALHRIPKLVLPAVLILTDGRACVLLDFPRRNSARVVMPESGGSTEDVELAKLKDDYAGYAIFARPVSRLDDRHEEAPVERPSSWFWGTLARHWWSYAQVILAAVLINIFALASPLFVMNVYDRVVPNDAIETLWVLAIGAATVFLFDFLLKVLRGYFIDLAGKNADVVLACRLFDQVLNMRMSARPSSAGGFASSLREFETLRDFFTSATLVAVVDLPFVLFFMAVIWALAGGMVTIHLIAVPMILAVGLALQWPLNTVVRRNLKEAEQKHGVLIESINGLETLKSLGAEARMRQKWERLVGLTAQSSLQARVISQGAITFAGLITNLTTIAVVIYGVFMIKDGALTVGGLIACVMLSGRALAPLLQVAQLLSRFHRSMVSLKSLNEIMRAPVERPTDRVFLHRPKLSGAITFNEVRFAYPNQSLDVLKGVSFKITAGERVGVVGRVGSGKSTIAKLILGLYDPTAGAVLMDGTDLRQIDPVDLRRNIGYVPQDVYLFRGSVAENISVSAPQAGDQAILDAAVLAGVDEFVGQHPMGYDLPVGERGEGLSGGQRQAIAIARALIHDPALMVLDEPTSSMDTRSEEAFKARLARGLPGRGMILITHRASLLSLVDRLVVLDGGRVVADGPRQAVMEALAGGKIATARI
jgi:ATP-binding cassette subfamily C protein LapB